jgi:hypothetical protein
LEEYTVNGKPTFLNSQQVRYVAEDLRPHTAVIRALDGDFADLEVSIDGVSQHFEKVPYSQDCTANTWQHVD